MVWFPCTDPLRGDDLTTNNSKSSMHVDWWWKRFRFVCKTAKSHQAKAVQPAKIFVVLPLANDVRGKIMFLHLSASHSIHGRGGRCVMMSLPVMDSTSPPPWTAPPQTAPLLDSTHLLNSTNPLDSTPLGQLPSPLITPPSLPSTAPSHPPPPLVNNWVVSFYIKICLMSDNKSVKEHDTQLAIWSSVTTVLKSMVQISYH